MSNNKIDLSKLELDKPYTWKEVCNLLNIKCRSGKGKQTDFNKLKTLAEENKKDIEVVGSGKGTRYIFRHLNLYNYTHKSNNNILGANMDKKGDDKNNNYNWAKEGVGKSMITNETIYFENESEDFLFEQIEKNKNKLNVGYSYTYKKLTEILEIKYHGTNTHSKERQLSFIMQQVCLSKEGTKYKVTRIYKIPTIRMLGNIDINNSQLSGNMILFSIVKYITEDKIISDYLDNNNYIFFSRPYLYEQMNLCNEEYNKFKYNHKQLAEETNVDKEQIEDLYYHLDSELKTMLKKGLKNLSTRRVLKYDDKNGICIVNKNGDKRLAKHEEIALFLEAEAEVKKALNIKNLNNYLSRGKGRIFYNAVNEYIKEQIKCNKKYKSLGENFDYYYKVIVFYATRRTLELGYEELIDDIELSLVNINDNFVDRNKEYFNKSTRIENKVLSVPKEFGIDKYKETKANNKFEYLQGIYLLLEKLVKCEKPKSNECSKYLKNDRD